MKSYWDAYSVADIGDKTHTYDYLYQSAKGVIDRERKLRTRNRLVGSGRGNNAFIVNDDNKAITDKDKERGRASRSMHTPDILCYFFQQGHCVHGKDCRYSHNTANYKIKAKRPGSYRPPSRSGTPSGRKNVCKFYGTREGCRLGSRCRYRHSSPTGKGKVAGKGSRRGSSPDYKSKNPGDNVPKRLPRSNPSGGHPATDNDRNDAEEERASDIRHAGGEAVIEDELISAGSES